ncbi:MAG: penicillin-binding protein 2, partial [Candidatus Kapabacteria bacterium]|nr:penicillin-binding protein 2 [Candidatus Kapabacteria bacterium]
GWTEYAFANWGIGQGEVTVTPLQMAMYTAALANGGTLYQPHAARAVYDKVLKRKERFTYSSHKVAIDERYFKLIQEAMHMVVNVPGGTASNGKVAGVDVCGKTGTAQNPHGQDHSWFVCFAPRERPTVAMCVMVENAGFGATVAVPIAQKLLDLYFNKTWPADVPRDSTRTSQDSSVLVRTQAPPTEPSVRGPFGIETPRRVVVQPAAVAPAAR